MSDHENFLLVPLKVDALVIASLQDAKPIENKENGKWVAGDLKWSPQGPDCARLLQFLPIAPRPFFGAPQPEDRTGPLIEVPDSAQPKEIVPKKEDEEKAIDPKKEDEENIISDLGVHIHWTLPRKLRTATRPDTLDFPPLPDQWLVVRFSQTVARSDPKVKAWFVDGGIVQGNVEDYNPDAEPPLVDAQGRRFSTLLVEETENGQTAVHSRRVGKSFPIEDYDTGKSKGRRTLITALGTPHTGSSTFTGFVAESRNILSWHDDLKDLPDDGAGQTLSYLVVGWYHNAANDPLRKIPEMMGFEINPAHIATAVTDLDKGAFSDLLRDEFATHSITLSRESVSVAKSGGGWKITDSDFPLPRAEREKRKMEAEDSVTRSFLIRRSQDSLRVQPSDILDILDWAAKRDRNAGDAPADLTHTTCLFHGMVAHVDFMDDKAYKQGPLLGYPGSPGAYGGSDGGTGRKAPPFCVGVGNSLEDALVALGGGTGLEPNKQGRAWWKALEAILYKKAERLPKETATDKSGWEDAERTAAVHLNGFTPHNGGTLWAIAAKASGEAPFLPTDAQLKPTPKPTDAQCKSLEELNSAQKVVDQTSREIAALGEDIYGLWWYNQRLTRDDDAGTAVFKRNAELLNKRLGARTNLIADRKDSEGKVKKLEDKLRAELGACHLELSSDAAPRFWTPRDPVIVVQGAQDEASRGASDSLSGIVQCRYGVRPALPAGSYPANIQVVCDRIKAVWGDALPLHSVIGDVLHESALIAKSLDSLVEDRKQPYGITSNGFRNRGEWDAWRTGCQKALEKSDSERLSAARPSVNLWRQQPWLPLFMDWQITWNPTWRNDRQPTNISEALAKGAIWRFDGSYPDYQPPTVASRPDKSFTIRGRTQINSISGFSSEPLKELEKLWSDLGYLDTSRDIDALKKGELIGQVLGGLHNCFLARDTMLPQITPDPAVDPDVKEALTADWGLEQDKPRIRSLGLAPPAVDGDLRPYGLTMQFDLLRAGSFTIDQLWMIDQFGQWADVLFGSSGKEAAGIRRAPGLHFPETADRSPISLPPRIVQPARLVFEFADPDPIAGWVFYHALDRALVVCAPDGALLGELSLHGEDAKPTTHWECLARIGQEAMQTDIGKEGADYPYLRRFVKPLIEGAGNLRALLQLIESADPVTRAGKSRLSALEMGRPLALVNTRLGLELFGKPWTAIPAPGGRTGNGALDGLRVAAGVNGARGSDALVGCYVNAAERGFDRILPAVKSDSSGYVADPQKEGIVAGFDTPQALTLLMDPKGAVQASVGILPARSISLPAALYAPILDQMETSFRVGPLLLPFATAGSLQSGAFSLPLPAGYIGEWVFMGESGHEDTTPVLPYDGKGRPADTRQIAREGRLIFRRSQTR